MSPPLAPSVRLADSSAHRYSLALWGVGALAVIGYSAGLSSSSSSFGYDLAVIDMPVLALTAGLVLAGGLFGLGLPALIRSSPGGASVSGRILLLMLAVGFFGRLILFVGEPILEDDYQRYLWDGSVVAQGLNPYVISPETARAADPRTTVRQLAEQSGQVIQRVNHPDLRTIYPPVAQAAFALAHALAPFSLRSWRTLLLLADLATIALLIRLHALSGLSPLWAALYWWNPVVLKELFNSAHMDGLLLPPMLLALLLAVRARPMLASASLAVAAGIKVWPVLLLPLLLHRDGVSATRAAVAVALCAIIVAVLAVPIIAGGLGPDSGFTAYVQHWQTNSALFPALNGLAEWLVGLDMGLWVRAAIGVLLAALSLWLARSSFSSANDLLGRVALLVAAVVLLSPAQFPWYTIWFAALLPFRPWMGFLVLSATVPLYYAGFYFMARDQLEVFKEVVVWVIWVPVWAALTFDVCRSRTLPLDQGLRYAR